MAVEQRMSEAAYEQFVLSGPDGLWELHDGRLVEKPGMSWEHHVVVAQLGKALLNALDPRSYLVFFEGRVRRPGATIFLPDLMVVPTAYGEQFHGQPGTLAIFADPLPLVVEVWSSSTGSYDIDTKIPDYQARGDLEIWRIHPYERTLTAWRRQPDGSYGETVHREGVVHPMALPDVAIDLAALFGARDA